MRQPSRQDGLILILWQPPQQGNFQTPSHCGNQSVANQSLSPWECRLQISSRSPGFRALQDPGVGYEIRLVLSLGEVRSRAGGAAAGRSDSVESRNGAMKRKVVEVSLREIEMRLNGSYLTLYRTDWP